MRDQAIKRWKQAHLVQVKRRRIRDRSQPNAAAADRGKRPLPVELLSAGTGAAGTAAGLTGSGEAITGEARAEELAKLLIYAAGLTKEEAGLFERIKDASPGEEIALLRIFIRRMLALVMEAGSLKEMFQTMNALGYIAGRLAKLFEVQIQLDRAAGEDDQAKAYAEVVTRMVQRFRESRQNTD